MHSLRWLYEKVTRTAFSSTSDANEMNSQIADLREAAPGCAATRDIVTDLYLPEGESQSLAQRTSSDGCDKAVKTAATEPTTPTTKQLSRIPKWTKDSGYGSASSFRQRRHRSAEDLHATPTKTARRMSLAFLDGRGISPDFRPRLPAGELRKEEEHARDRHDSVLSSHVSGAVDNKEVKPSNDSDRFESPLLCTQVYCNIPSDDRALRESGNIERNFEPQVAQPVSESECSQNTSGSSQRSLTRLEARTSSIPCREKLNQRFENLVNDRSPFWKVGDGIDEPQILQQVSCLQCILKKLPCNKKPPSCSRCMRSGHGPCLVQRDLLAEERWKAGLWGTNGGASYSVLVRLKGDDEEIWVAKKAMEAGMLAYLAEQHDRSNWIVPRANGTVGSFKKSLHVEKPKYQLDYARGHFS